MKIRKAQTEDALNIKFLKIQVWLHTYSTRGINNVYSEYLETEFTYANCLKSICDKTKCCLIVEIDEYVIAYSEIDFNAINPDTKLNMAEMTILYVSEHFYGQGIGKALLRETEKQLTARGQSTYWLSCFIENQNALNFYKHLGFNSNASIYFTMGDNRYENLVFQKEVNTI